MRTPCRSAVVLFTSLVCAVVVVPAAELRRGYRLEPVVTGLTEPTALDSTPDGRILITERTTGDLRVVQDGELLAAPLCHVAVTTTGEGGLLGVAVHPDFANSGWVYLYFTERAPTGRNTVARFTIQGTACLGRVNILSILGVGPSGLRNGGGIAFGPDAKLYVATGDVESSSNSQNDGSLRGKVLRLNDDGSVPADNPTPGSLVYAKGVRDGRGIAVGASGKVYSTDAGLDPTVFDEVNHVRAGANLGWDITSGSSGGAYDDPWLSYSPVVGVRGLAVFGASAFPDQAADGIDNDLDRLGADWLPGVQHTDDNNQGECLGGARNGLSCTTGAECTGPRYCSGYTESVTCWKADEMTEYCPAGAAYGDDACGAASAVHPEAGVDEPDESFVNSVFYADYSAHKIMRSVPNSSDLSQLNVNETFLDSNVLGDCPHNWTDVMGGRDGWLYAIATNGGGGNGGLYRVIHDVTPGPREVSADNSYFPLHVQLGAAVGVVEISWEDLRSDATQPRDDGAVPQAPVREYTVWQGILGSFYSHSPVPGLDRIEGTAVNDAYRRTAVYVGTSPANLYFLVSARHADLEGSLGKASDGTERPGYAVTDDCSTIGYHSAANSFALWKCGQNFTLVDELGETHSLYEYREKVVVLNFGAVWCGYCALQMDTMEADLQQPYKDRGVVFLTILMDSDNSFCPWQDRPTAAECRKWSDRSPAGPSAADLTFPCWADPKPPAGQTQKAFPLYDKWHAIPTNVVLDTGLRVVYSAAGYYKDDIRNVLDRLVGMDDTCLP